MVSLSFLFVDSTVLDFCFFFFHDEISFLNEFNTKDIEKTFFKDKKMTIKLLFSFYFSISLWDGVKVSGSPEKN